MAVNSEAILSTPRNSLLDRLSTFHGRNSSISPTILAHAGFQMISDQIKCPICSLEVPDGFDKSQNILTFHESLSGNCSFFNSECNDSEKHTNIDQSEMNWQTEEVNVSENENQLVSHELLIIIPYKDEMIRYLSLKKSKTFSERASELAKAGFFAITAPNDYIRCFACVIIIVSLKPNDNPLAIHKKLCPECPFLNSKDVGNIPYDKIAKLYTTESNNFQMDYLKSQSVARYPDMNSLDNRLRSFANYPKDAPITTTALAEAGLFYQGYGDQVVCFSCGVFLRNWNIDDDAWIEHSRWSEFCIFVINMKGIAFVKQSKNFVNALKEHKRQTGIQTENSATGNHKVDDGVGFLTTRAPTYKEAEKIPLQVTEYLNGDIVADILLMGFNQDAIQNIVMKYFQGSGKFPDRFSLLCQLKDVHEDDQQRHKMKAETQDVSEQNEITSEEQKLCSICYAQPRSILFLGCGHLTTCESCAANAKLLTCPLCRVLIKGTVKVFFS